MAKTARKPAAKVTSKSKKLAKKHESDDEVGQDPPIIIKSGALPTDGDDGYSMQMECLAPMDFSYDPKAQYAYEYSYSTEILREISSIIIKKDGIVVCSQKVTGLSWEIVLESLTGPERPTR